MTESAYFSSLGRNDCYKELDAERYKIVATLDMRTSAICRDMAVHIFKRSEYAVGTTAPPFHVYCRTTTT